MKRPAASDVQRAIQFLSSPEFAGGRHGPLPARPDYEFLARQASGLGHNVSPGAVREAFRLIIRTRLVLPRGLSRSDGGER